MRLALLIIALCTVAAPRAEAFGRDGHRIVCDIAYDHLNETARADVDLLIASDAEFAHFRDVCSWADRVRNTTHTETAPYHYVGLSRDDPIVNYEDCPDQGCVLTAILADGARYRDRRNSVAERLEALKFLAHWIGDVHQPLHVSIDGDRGGNDIKSLWRGERMSNFHRMWDSEIILDYMAARWAYLPEKERWRQFSAELKSELAVSGVHVSAPLEPLPWAQESHDLARSRDVAYQYADADVRFAPGEHYYQRHLTPIKKRLKEAGIRLAAVLNHMATVSGPSPARA
ncbi:MAG: S1/P1 nuclease, partial [Pseudomonadota bacterium]